MAVTSAESIGQKPDQQQSKKKGTRLDNHVDRPSSMEPGDTPHDTTDPSERATSVTPDKAAAGRAGYGTVNAVVPLPDPERESEPAKDPRYETYEVQGPDGKLVTVRRNLETGESEKQS